jgi:hypothetical protein
MKIVSKTGTATGRASSTKVTIKRLRGGVRVRSSVKAGDIKGEFKL